MIRQFILKEYAQTGNKAKQLPWSQPVSLQKKDLPTIWGCMQDLNIQYVVSPKADGFRKVWGCMPHKMDFFTGFDLPTDERKTPKPPLEAYEEAYHGTLIDCEYRESTKTLWIIDVVSINGHNIRRSALHYRLTAATIFIEAMAKKYDSKVVTMKAGGIVPFATTLVEGYRLCIKPLWYVDDLASLWEWCQTQGLLEDGLVYTPVTSPTAAYRDGQVLKWKPVEKHTVDFVVKGSSNDYDSMDLYVTEDGKTLALYATVPIQLADPSLPLYNGKVYECCWKEDSWWLLRYRKDKRLPNARLTVDRTCQNIHEALTWQELLPPS